MTVELFAIFARAANGAIGKDGRLPWHLPTDLKRFKRVTMGLPMIMGRKTFDSFGGLLEGRRHIVLTRDRDWSAQGAEVAHSAEEALDLARNGNADTPSRIAVIGGAEIYRLLLPRCDRVELTEVHAEPEGDTFLPELGEEWREIAREDHASQDDRPAFSFVTYRRTARDA